MKSRSIQERFNEKFVREPITGCWIWNAGGCNGVGVLIEKWDREGKKLIYAHRFSYKHYTGEIENKDIVKHKCENTLCVNPKHLFLKKRKKIK